MEERERLRKKANFLRRMGYTYKEIGISLNIDAGRAWALVNVEASREITRNSSKRYRERGYKALWQGEEENA